MTPKKSLLNAFTNNKAAVAKFNGSLAAALLIRTIAQTYEDDATEVLKKFGLCIGDIKDLANKSDKAFDRYRKVAESYISDEEMKKLFVADYEILQPRVENVIREYCDDHEELYGTKKGGSDDIKTKDLHYCGECSVFRYEDTDGYGYCQADGMLRRCSDSCPNGRFIENK